MTDPTVSKNATVALRPCPFCSRSMRYEEYQGVFDWLLLIKHEYDTTKLYMPCPMQFFKHIVWRDRISGEVFDENVVNRHKQWFIDVWNRRVNE